MERTRLLDLAVQLRASAADADRPDVVAKVDEAILLILGESAGPTEKANSKSDAVLRFLNGLGY